MFFRPTAGSLLVGAIVTAAAATVIAQGAPPQGTPALTVSGTPANDTAKGASLMSEARKALGGEDKIAAIKRLEAKGTMTQVTAAQTLEGDVDLMIEAPDKLRIDQEIELPGGSITINRTQALNGADVWDVTEGGLPGGFGRGGGGRGGDGGFRGGGGGNQGGRLGGVLAGALGTDATQGRGQLDPERQAQLKEQQRKARQTDLTRYLVAFFATTTDAPAWIGTAVTPKDEKADVLEFPTVDGTTTRLFLDITTHMPLMMTYSAPAPRTQGQGRPGQGRRGRGDAAGADAGQGAPAQAAAPSQPGAPQGAPAADGQGGGRRGGGGFQPQQVTMEMYLGDYKVENGLKLPHHITRELNGEIQEELVLKSFKINPNFKSNTFTQPKQ